jgi:hypothetical protein
MASAADLPPISKFFLPLPEANLKTRRRIRLGRVYVCAGREDGARLFMDAVTHGIPGLWVSEVVPEIIRKRWKLSATPILWITQRKRTEEVVARPDELERILNITRHYFLGGMPRAVLFIDCLPVLIRANGLPRTIGVVRELGRVCRGDNAALIISLEGLGESERDSIRKAIGSVSG